MMRRLKIWYRAVILDYPYWRVRYTKGPLGGEITYLLHYREASGISGVFGGILYIDYTVKM